ncbi:MAG TPA: hypothetical protein VMS76_02910 [Planctomycetota bacterium]|nr:hypothetical protein [Planctomycetota bacterium]
MTAPQAQRCCCYLGHASASGRCTARADEVRGFYCEECRRDCYAMDPNLRGLQERLQARHDAQARRDALAKALAKEVTP